ncbi:hypothetical protein JTF08_02515 [Micrococcaceae bacterium RIT802]|nr:hypothetical protein [Micrococcaceae bacterium RIT 802]
MPQNARDESRHAESSLEVTAVELAEIARTLEAKIDLRPLTKTTAAPAAAGTTAPASARGTTRDLLNSQHGKLIMAAINMERSVAALGPALAEVEVETSPQLARSMQATENAWRKMEAEFGLLTSLEVSRAVGSKSPNRSYASDQRGAGRLLAVKRPGGYKYPGFQIDRREQAIRPVMHDLIRLAADADRSESGLALWMISPTGYLDGSRPVDLLDEPDQVVAAARQSFNVQW